MNNALSTYDRAVLAQSQTWPAIEAVLSHLPESLALIERALTQALATTPGAGIDTEVQQCLDALLQLQGLVANV